MDRINIRNVKIEILSYLDAPPDQINDQREETWKKMMEEFQRTGRVKQ